jgi:hypothetical protein
VKLRRRAATAKIRSVSSDAVPGKCCCGDEEPEHGVGVDPINAWIPIACIMSIEPCHPDNSCVIAPPSANILIDCYRLLRRYTSRLSASPSFSKSICL